MEGNCKQQILKSDKVGSNLTTCANVSGKRQGSEKPSDDEFSSLSEFIQDVDSSKVYRRGNLLGIGGFGRVYQVTEMGTDKTTSIADKIISKAIFQKRSSAREKVKREINIHMEMAHVNVVKFLDSFEDNLFVHILLENCTQNSLLHVLQNRATITEPETRYYMKQILEGTMYIHQQGFLHRDLKLGNMLLSKDMIIKIGDFGLACRIVDSKAGGACGTPNYIAPEVLARSSHGVEADIWSCGCMMFAMLCGKPPFETQGLKTTYKKIASCDYSVPDYVSAEAKSMMETMLALEVDMRGHLGVQDAAEKDNLFLHVFFQTGFTPISLPQLAVHTAPRFDDYPPRNFKIPQSMIPQVREVSAAMRIRLSSVLMDDNNNGTLPSSCSVSPFVRTPLHTFSPPPPQPFSVALQQRLGNFFGGRKTFVQRVVDNLGKSRKQCQMDPTALNIVPVFITKWIDYSNKYGFGFQLSDKTTGVKFNDKTKIAACGQEVEFVDMKNNLFYINRKDTPTKQLELKNQVALLDLFIRHMEKHLANSNVDFHNHMTVITKGRTRVVQMKEWHRGSRPDTVVMLLNNRLIQVNFLVEHVKIVAWEDSNEMFLTMVDCRHRIHTYSMSSLMAKGSPMDIHPWISKTLVELEALQPQVVKKDCKSEVK